MSYNIQVLIEATQDYFVAETDLRNFLKTWVPGWWEGKTAEQREKYTKYTERSQATFNTVIMMCKLVNVDMDALLSMVKAINRWEKGQKWEYCIHVTYRTEDNVRRALANRDCWSTHYQSTGRKIAA